MKSLSTCSLRREMAGPGSPPPCRLPQFRLHVEGAGKIGFIKGDGLLTFTEAESATEVRYEGEVHVGGTIASVGQRLVDGTAKMLIKRFFEKLSTEAVTASVAG